MYRQRYQFPQWGGVLTRAQRAAEEKKTAEPIPVERPPTPEPPKEEIKRQPEPEPEAAPEPKQSAEIDAKQYLKDLATELHKPIRHKFPTRRIFAPAKDDTWAMDLADMSTWAEENDGYTFILTIVDVFTRWAAARALKTKSAAEVLAAVKDVIRDSGRQPKFIYCDQGTEFVNKEMAKWRRQEGIGLYHTFGQHKASVVERFNRTLKTIMWRTLTAKNSHEWVEELPQLIATYNGTTHSTLKMTPNYASDHPEKAAERWAELRKKQRIVEAKPLFKVGDVVRIARSKATFEKGYDASWTRSTYKIARVDSTISPIVYHLTEYNGEPIQGAFYAEELQRVRNPDVFLVESILKRRGKGDKEELFVKWLGWPDRYNSWIKASDSVDV